MSTLKVSTIQDTSGNNSSTPAGIASGTAKAWVSFDGTGTVSIKDNFNVSSITDNSTGDYTANFTTAMSNANYCISGMTMNSNNFIAINSSDTPNTAYIRVAVRNHDGTDEDSDYVCVCIHTY